MDREEKVTEVRRSDDVVDNDQVSRERVSTEENHVSEVPGNVMARRVVYYIGGAIIALLAVRFIFALLGASEAAPFAAFIYGLSSIFVAPFFGIFGEPSYGVSQFETSTLVAIIIYALLTVGIGRLFTLGTSRTVGV